MSQEYIKQLEDQNEELRKLLAYATQDMYVIKWNRRDDGQDYNDSYAMIYEMRVHGLLFCFMLEDKRGDNEFKYHCVFKNYSVEAKANTIVDCMAAAKRYYESTFILDEPRL
jgi:hypothetical protein